MLDASLKSYYASTKLHGFISHKAVISSEYCGKRKCEIFYLIKKVHLIWIFNRVGFPKVQALLSTLWNIYVIFLSSLLGGLRASKCSPRGGRIVWKGWIRDFTIYCALEAEPNTWSSDVWTAILYSLIPTNKKSSTYTNFGITEKYTKRYALHFLFYKIALM